jgi:hypothetical protein
MPVMHFNFGNELVRTTRSGASTTHTGGCLPFSPAPTMGAAANGRFWVKPPGSAFFCQLIKPDGSVVNLGPPTPIGGAGTLFTFTIPAVDLNVPGENVVVVFDDSGYTSVVCSTCFLI